MNKKVYFLFAAIFLLCSVIVLTGCKFMDKVTVREGKVINVSGTVTVTKVNEGKTFNVIKGMLLTQGDRIKTEENAYLTLELGSEKELRVSENSDVTLNDLIESRATGTENTGISLNSGAVWASVKKKLNSGSKFEITTPTAVMGVRGTKFSVLHNEGTSKLTVIEGSVAATKTVEVVNPDGSTSKKKITAIVDKYKQVEIDDSIQKEEDFKIEPISPDSLDPFTLGIVQELVKTQPDIVDDDFKEQLKQTNGVSEKEEQQKDSGALSSVKNAWQQASGLINNRFGGLFGAKLPQGYPKDLVPIIPGGNIVFAMNEKDSMLVTIMVEKSYQEVFNYYQGVMKDANAFTNSEFNNAFVLSGEKAGYGIAITGTPTDGQDKKNMMGVAIVITPIQKE